MNTVEMSELTRSRLINEACLCRELVYRLLGDGRGAWRVHRLICEAAERGDCWHWHHVRDWIETHGDPGPATKRSLNRLFTWFGLVPLP